MKKYLIIFEGTWKIDTVKRYIKDIEKKLWWKVELAATWWHILSSPYSELWIDIKEKWWKYVFNYKLKPETSKTKKTIKYLKEKIEDTLKSWWKVILATDFDRAWEMIAKEVIDYFKLKKWDYYRLYLTSIEKEDFLKKLDELKEWLTKSLYEAEEVRMILDKLWWYVKSPILYSRLNDNDYLFNKIDTLINYLNAKKEEFIEKNEKYVTDSRVRTFLKRIDDMINELKKFKQWKYWKKPLYTSSVWRVQLPMSRLIIHEWMKNFKEIKAKNYIKLLDENEFKWNMNEKQIEEINLDEIHKIYEEIKNSELIEIKKVTIKNKKMKSKKPYNETSLVSDANTILWFSPKKTSSLAQKLYERGITTYYRTKWDWYTDWSYKYIKNLLSTLWLKEDLDNSKKYKLEENAWHDAIRPAYKGKIIINEKWLYVPADEVLSEDEEKIFDLILRRNVASVMKDARIIELNIEWEVKNKYKFELKISFIEEEWFLKMYHWSKKNITNLISLENKNKIEEIYKKWNKLKIKDVILEEWKFQFSDMLWYSTFKNTLESKKIWTPATFIPIFEKIKERWYVLEVKNKLLPLPKWLVINLLTKDIEVNDLDFTEKLLDKIEQIEEWKLSKDELLNEIFKKYFIEAYKNYQSFTFKKKWTKKWRKKKKTTKK